MVSIAPDEITRHRVARTHHDAEAVAECMALLAMGHSSRQVSDRTGIPARTIREWTLSPEIAAKYSDAIKAGRERIAYRWTQVVEDTLDRIEDGEEKINAVQAMTGWGIATDKIQREGGGGPQVAVRIKHADGTVVEVGARA